MTVHVAYINDDKELGTCWFASLDGDVWLEVSRQLHPEDEQALKDKLEPHFNGDGNKVFYITSDRRYLRHHNAVFLQ